MEVEEIPPVDWARQETPPANVLTGMHYVFMGVACIALLAITVFSAELAPIVGHPACISLLVVVLAFGSGFMSKREFKELDWDLLAFVGGVNVMAFLVRETGLGVALSSTVVASEFVTLLPYLGLIALLICGTLITSTVVGHSLTGVVILPLVVALGVKLQAPEMTAILVAIAIPYGMGHPRSSLDNVQSYMTSMDIGQTQPRKQLSPRDFRISGGVFTIFAGLLVLSLGYGICTMNFGPPPPVGFSQTGTPEKLKPKVVKENIPKEAEEVKYTEKLANWTTFEKKREKKAFAVGSKEPGMKTRAWAAAWGHRTQEEANEAALRDCQKVSKKCRIIYPEARPKELSKKGNDTFAGDVQGSFLASRRAAVLVEVGGEMSIDMTALHNQTRRSEDCTGCRYGRNSHRRSMAALTLQQHLGSRS